MVESEERIGGFGGMAAFDGLLDGDIVELDAMTPFPIFRVKIRIDRGGKEEAHDLAVAEEESTMERRE